jgi:type IX secretion system PorP/SprF family membrane protein
MKNPLLLRKFMVTSFVVLSVLQLKAQDVHFSQFFEAPLLRNPALSGIFNGDVRVQTIFRNQWASLGTPYKTVSVNGEYKQPIGNNADFLTLGMQVLYDKAGAINFTTTNVYPSVNYHKALSEYHNSYLSVGFMGGLVQRKIDRTKMTTNSQFDGSGYNPSLADGETFTQPNYTYLDGSAGVSYNSSFGEDEKNNFFVGLAYHHFNRPKNSFYKDPTIELSAKYVASAGVKLNVNEVSYLTFHGDFSSQAAFKEYVGGAMFSYKMGEDYDNPAYTIHLGGILRWQDAFVPVVKMDYNPFSFAVSYDVNISQLKTSSQGQGGFELSLSYTGFLDRDNSSKNAVRCPKF